MGSKNVFNIPNASRNPWDTDPIGYLVTLKFPLAAVAALPSLNRSNPQPLAELRQQKEADAYRVELQSLDASELQSRVQTALKSQIDAKRQLEEAEEQRRPYNQPHAIADCERWAKMGYWTIDEAVALSFDKDPAYANPKAFQYAFGSPFAQQFADRKTICSRAVAMGQLSETTTPSNFLAWAKRMRVDVPVALVKAVEDLGIQIADWKTLFDQQSGLIDSVRKEVADERAKRLAEQQDYVNKLKETGEHIEKQSAEWKALVQQKDELLDLLEARIAELEREPAKQPQSKELAPRERESLLKLVIGMAMGWYGYDPKAARHSQTAVIASDLERAGLSLDPDTVRRYLNEAKQLLPSGDT